MPKNKICRQCNKEFIGHHFAVTCSTECNILYKKDYKNNWYKKNYEPKPRVLKTEQHFKQYEKDYNSTPERKKFMHEYRRRPENLIKERASGKKYVEKNPEVKQNGHFKRNFGISLDDYKNMLSCQDNKCVICLKPETKVHKKTNKVINLAVDHCHKSGKIRGLLCWSCNTSIGKFNDDVEVLQRAINYLNGAKNV